MSWQIRLEIRDVSDLNIANALLTLSTWTGSGNVIVEPQRPVEATVDLTVPDQVINVTIALTHPRYANLVINLVRGPGENRWRWTDPRVRVTTQGRLVIVRAILTRVRPAPLTSVPEQELASRAEQAKAPLDRAARNHRPPRQPPEQARMDPIPGVLREGDHYRHSGMPDEQAMHILAPNPLGDAGQTDWQVQAPGWGRFRTTIKPVAPNRSGRIHLVEYGEVGTQGRGPRFLVAVWLPHELARVGRGTIDFLVWFTPNTNPPGYPAFPGDYPFIPTAHGTGPYTARQPYVELPFAHWSIQHFIVYQMLAAKRSAAVVIPVAPSSDFALWVSPTTLMHMLKDICRWIPRDDDGRIPKIHPTPPAVGRVGVAGFSSAADRLDALLQRSGPDIRYGDRAWGSPASDHADFDRAWRELWLVDGAFHGSQSRHERFLERCAQWVQNPDRQLRLYKNDFTDGRWDPRNAPPRSAFAHAMRNAVCVERGDGSHWALSCTGSTGAIRTLSMSKSYSVSPGSAGSPVWDNRPHENMPRLCLGHAFATSGYAPLEQPASGRSPGRGNVTNVGVP